MSAPQEHTLYHFDFSICSIMVRYAIALCSDTEERQQYITIREQSIDIMHREHFTENFLCNLNPRGEVPVLALQDGQAIADSVAITEYLAKFYPSMIPTRHDRKIRDLLTKLHGVNFFSITFAGHPEGQQSNKLYLQDLLLDKISDEYRKAIEGRIEMRVLIRSSIEGMFKLTECRIDDHLDQLGPGESQKNEDYARDLMGEFDELLSKSASRWLLGVESPTALDAHLISFIVRMLDRKREDLIPERLQRYGLEATNEKAWQDVMRGRSTLPLKI